jgi:hypothetical protein
MTIFHTLLTRVGGVGGVAAAVFSLQGYRDEALGWKEFLYGPNKNKHIGGSRPFVSSWRNRRRMMYCCQRTLPLEEGQNFCWERFF